MKVNISDCNTEEQLHGLFLIRFENSELFRIEFLVCFCAFNHGLKGGCAHTCLGGKSLDDAMLGSGGVAIDTGHAACRSQHSNLSHCIGHRVISEA